jgi:thiol-disulfide isomerase/thioredoxin
LSKALQKILYLIICAASLCLFGHNLAAQDNQPRLKNNKLYETVLVDSNHQKLIINQLVSKGKPVLFIFFTDWCAPCHAAMDTLTYLKSRLESEYNLQIIPVALNTSKRGFEVVYSTAKLHHWTFNIYFDGKDDAKNSYRIAEVPHLMFIDKEGKIAYEKRGFDPNDFEYLELVLKAIKNKEEGR